MAKENNINQSPQQDNPQRSYKGLHQDHSPGDQIKDTYRFALNTVNETELGDFAFLSNEESNEICADIGDFIILNRTYISDKEQVLFLVSPDESESEIGILDNNCGYVPLINDRDSIKEHKLNFKINKQIDSTYRLRLGCERTIYFTDDYNLPRYVNLDSLEDYKNPDKTWNANLFSLQKRVEDIPEFDKIEVLEAGGNLYPGSVNVSIQYLDKGLNPTEWITTSQTVKIYNDLTTQEYREINGSINSEADYLNYPNTGKAIGVHLNSLDVTFPYYRLAFIISDSGSGVINKIHYTDEISTSNTFFIYTGENAPYDGTEEDIKMFTSFIHKAKHIEQVENMLILANTEGNPVNFCKLQKYASKIKADCYLKEVNLSDIMDESNPKNPTHEIGGLGYMPGEIYSFGIVYVFEGGEVSPVYHIPGKSPYTSPNTIFSPGPKVFPMSSENSGKSLYSDSNSCGGSSYWGLDSEGIPLLGKNVRHHRFPLRSELNIPLVEEKESGSGEVEIPYYKLVLRVQGDLLTPVECDEGDEDCTPQETFTLSIRVTYKVNGEEKSFTATINPDTYADGTGIFEFDRYFNSNFHGTTIDMSSIEIEETDINGAFQEEYSQWSNYFESKPTYTVTQETHTSTVDSKTFKTNILGIKFSGIDIPKPQDTGGKKVIGYYIVRNERTEFEKTIIDSGVLIPTLENEKYIAQGLLAPETTKIRKDVWGFIHPEHKFNDRKYVTYDELIHQGSFKIEDRKYGKITYNDVHEGTSWDPGVHKSRSQTDEDGFSLDVISRDNILAFKKESVFNLKPEDLKEKFYLDALGYKTIEDNRYDVYNIAADNKIGIIQTKNDTDIKPVEGEIPYVVLKKNSLDPYGNFKVTPYYLETKNILKFSSDTDNTAFIMNGDSYVTPMRYVNTIFWDNRIARRKEKGGKLKKIAGAFLAVAGILTAVFTGGSSLVLTGIGLSLAGAGITLLNSGIKMDNVARAYLEEYEKGLRETALDDWVDAFYNYRDNEYTNPSSGGSFGFEGNGRPGYSGPSDDSIQWIGDCFTDLWVESTVNTSLRIKMTSDLPSFLDAPGRIESGNDSKINTWEYHGIYWTVSDSRYPISSLERHLAKKLLAFDPEKEDSRVYLGMPLGEWYFINPDYKRRNKQKVYFHLPSEYDCCSDCIESFPQRIHYSEQSFQEELTDYYRVFLPNNYRDLDGETGEITNMFKIGNNLYSHTQGSLWLIPNSRQERVNSGIVTYIGTGSFFEVPPQRLRDSDSGFSAGLQHKWATLKTPLGYVYVSEEEKKVFLFDGQNIQDISNQGISKWFRNNIEILLDSQYESGTNITYKFKDNPSNIFGTGFLLGYDSSKERVLLTKRDFLFTDEVMRNGDFEVCVKNNTLIVFPNMSQIISQQRSEGWFYEGIEDCKLKFIRDKVENKSEHRTIVEPVLSEDYISNGDTSKDRVPLEVIEVEDKTINYLVPEVMYIEGVEVPNPIRADNSWTLSYSLKMGSWTSWHSYIPNFYIFTPEKFYSWKNGVDYIWKHNVKGRFQNFYGKKVPHIIEYVSVSNPLITRIWNHIRLITEAKKYDPDMDSYYEQRYVTFDQMVAYNSRQTTGLLNLMVKEDLKDPQNYLSEQIINTNNNVIVIDRKETDWLINDLRDIRINYESPIWNYNLDNRQNNYFIDKVLNESSLDIDKSWTDLESFRDKYLVIRLIFNNFAERDEQTKLITKYSVENEQYSYR